MAGDTAIEWADATWNPIVGCAIVSPGCKHCYAMGQAARIERMAEGAGRATHYAGTTQPSKAGPVWTGKVALAGEQALTAPLRWTKPRRIFVNSMGDLFAEGVVDAWLDRVFAVMALAPQHTFIVLTKRPERMRAYVADCETGRGDTAYRVRSALGKLAPELCRTPGSIRSRWPLPNLWLGVTAEDQPRADERVPVLLATPAAVRIVSVEPMIGPVNLTCLPGGEVDCEPAFRDVLNKRDHHPDWEAPEVWAGPGVDWVILGGESGHSPNIRPMHPDWARQVRDDCDAAGVPFFFKQWGEWGEGSGDGAFWLRRDGCGGGFLEEGAAPMHRVGKRAAGGALDGVVHHAWPEARA